ncbi:MAG TPA: Ig-like domain-containing protein [Candidatus Paceibacterota bacterium]|nr:Ig-like domain-containing protein [Candidatus Paceibacterota bacterium]
MKKSAILALFGLLIPLSLLAVYPETAQGAGFAKESLFLSKTPVTEGDTVLIHTVVSNDTGVNFSGEVIFKNGDAKIGGVAVTIAAGGANAVSVSWKPGAGTHTVTAELDGADGAVVEKESGVFVINPKPQPASQGATEDASVESSQAIQNDIAHYSPTAASIAQPVFSTIDSARNKAADLLDQGTQWASQQSGGKSPGQVLGDATTTVSLNPVGTAWKLLASVIYYILTFLRYVVGHAGIFYPVFVILFFYILWRTYKRFRRPRYSV